jgi:hypothetical protein
VCVCACVCVCMMEEEGGEGGGIEEGEGTHLQDRIQLIVWTVCV